MNEDRRARVDNYADLSHRISMLELDNTKLEERTQSTSKRVELLEKAHANSEERLDAMNDVHAETMATLSKMQITLEQLNEVLTTFNKWKSTKDGIKTIGEFFIWTTKVVIVIGVLWSAMNFGHIGFTNSTTTTTSSTNPTKSDQTVVKKEEKTKALLDTLDVLEK